MYGGFDIKDYLKIHAHEEFVETVRELDKKLPVYYTNYIFPDGYQYDEDGNEVLVRVRVSYGWSMSEATRWENQYYKGYYAHPNTDDY